MALIYTALLEKALEHFPRWMDIKKRRRSKGQEFLSAQAQEIAVIQDEIDQYVSEHFARSYVGAEDTIPYELYRVPVGSPEILNSVGLVSPSLPVTLQMRSLLFSIHEQALYFEGSLLFRRYPGEVVSYKINDALYEHKPEAIRIWNIFDEFALFTGLERYESESNQRLLKRTVEAYKRPTDSTEQGIRNAVLNALEGVCSVTPEDVVIEPVGTENLLENTWNDKTVLEWLLDINHDVYRTKEWGDSLWGHDFAQTEYIAHPWDHMPAFYQNGVGQTDDLKVTLTDQGEHAATDLSVTYLKQSEEEIENHVRNNIIEDDFTFTFRKYENMLRPQTVPFQVLATEARDITDEDIFIEAYQQVDGAFEYPLEDLMINSADFDHIATHPGEVPQGDIYRLAFRPIHRHSDMIISKALVSKDGTEQDLRQEKASYVLQGDDLINSRVKFHGQYRHQFDDGSNVREIDGGMTLSSRNEAFRLTKKIDGLKNQFLFVSHSCQSTNATRNTTLVEMTNAHLLPGENKIFTDHAEGKIKISGIGNHIGVTIESGQARYRTESSEWQYFNSENEEPVVLFYDFVQPKTFNIEIENLNASELLIRDVLHAHYEVSVTTEKGNLELSHGYYLLPDEDENVLTISMAPKSAFLPRIHYVHVGADVSRDVYYTDPVTSTDNTYFSVETNCVVTLEKQLGGQWVEERAPFKTAKIYHDNDNDHLIPIDTSRFVTIHDSTPRIEKRLIHGQPYDCIVLRAGTEISAVRVSGVYRSLVRRASLKDIIGFIPGERLYVDRFTESMIRKKDSGADQYERHFELTPEKILGGVSPYRVSYYLVQAPSGVQASFYSRTRSSKFVSNDYDWTFDNLVLQSTAGERYIANQWHKMVVPEATGLAMTRGFGPIPPSNTLMVYQLTGSLNHPGAEIDFEVPYLESGITGTSNHSVSVGRKNIRIYMGTDMLQEHNYQVGTVQHTFKSIVSSRMALPEFIDFEDESRPIQEFIVESEDRLRPVYQSREAEVDIIAEEDGYNKLPHSNIQIMHELRADGNVVSTSDYQLLGREGILVWLSNQYSGMNIQCEYQYQKPVAFEFVNLDDLYRLATYSVQAYRKMAEEHIVGLKPGSYPLGYTGADRTVLSISNPSFRGSVVNGRLIIEHVSQEERVLVKSGYVYHDWKEYYHFATGHNKEVQRFGGVDIVNGGRRDGRIQFQKESSNFLKNSAMIPGRKAVTSKADFVNHDIYKGVSLINEYSACENFHSWYFSNMALSLTEAHNGPGIAFTPTGPASYAFIDVSEHLEAGKKMQLSFHKKGEGSVFLAQKATYDDMAFNQLIFISPVIEMPLVDEEKELYGAVFKPQKNLRYYALVRGEAVIDDILVRKAVQGQLTLEDHQKEIDKHGWQIHEPVASKTILPLTFDAKASRMHQVEIGSDNVLKTSMQVQWGLTAMRSFENNWSACEITGLLPQKGIYVSDNSAGTIETEVVHLQDREFIKKIVAKANRVLTEEYDGINITLLTSKTRRGQFKPVKAESSNNILSVDTDLIENYIKLRAEVPPHTVIESLTLFCVYGETEDKAMPLRSFNEGQLITRYYDLGERLWTRVQRVNGVSPASGIRLSIRGYRENEKDRVHTAWHEINFSTTGVPSHHVEFENYRFYQLKIDIDDPEIEVDLSSFQVALEVIR